MWFAHLALGSVMFRGPRGALGSAPGWLCAKRLVPEASAAAAEQGGVWCGLGTLLRELLDVPKGQKQEEPGEVQVASGWEVMRDLTWLDA